MQGKARTAPVFNIQSYSIHDGPGIRVTVFLKGCPLHCLWCANPESNSQEPQLLVYEGRCVSCGACIPACPQGCIRMVSGKTVTDRSRCMACGACAEACRFRAREIAGRDMTVSEVMEAVERDRIFFGSDGGLTVSGGECLYHPLFTEELLQAAKARGIGTAVESCCYASEESIRRVFRYVDTALLDIKQMDDVLHKEYTGVSNKAILDNIILVHGMGVAIRIRIPVIPGYTDQEDNIRGIAAFVAGRLGREVPVDLLPYHRMGESKNESLGREMDMSIAIPSAEHMAHLRSIVEGYGLECRIGG